MGIKTHEVQKYQTTEHYAWYVQCPACKTPHSFDHRWKFDGNHEAPTFSPSMLVKWREGTSGPEHVCHSFLEAGVWRFLGDCTHAMKNQRVAAPDWELPSGMPETAAAAKAQADAKKAADELEAKKLDEAAKVAAAEAAAKAQAEKDAAADGPPEAVEHLTAKDRHEAKKAAARLFIAFRSQDVGLSDTAASVLAAHCLLTEKNPQHMGGTEAIAWARNFRSKYPVVWGALRIGHMMNFAAAARRSELRTGTIPQLEELASAIRS